MMRLLADPKCVKEEENKGRDSLLLVEPEKGWERFLFCQISAGTQHDDIEQQSVRQSRMCRARAILCRRHEGLASGTTLVDMFRIDFILYDSLL